MAMHRTSRSLITLVAALLVLVIMPMAVGARGLETPHSTPAVAEGWLGAALDWFQDVLSLRGRGSRHPSPPTPIGIQEKDSGLPAGGSCIDPQGIPRPGGCR
jgi:hypothetical protein